MMPKELIEDLVACSIYTMSAMWRFDCEISHNPQLAVLLQWKAALLEMGML